MIVYLFTKTKINLNFDFNFPKGMNNATFIIQLNYFQHLSKVPTIPGLCCLNATHIAYKYAIDDGKS